MNRKLRGRMVVAVVLAAMSITSVRGAKANFTDDWLSQANGTNAGYYEGSQRGYFSGGSFSARWPQSTDNLLTISKPSLKSGCGGIDMFLGGMSFLNVDYLVQKLQHILSAAPAAAFDIALKTLAPQVSDTIKTMEAFVDKLNNLQLDDCKAAKALVATTASPFSSVMSDSVAAELTSAKADFMQSSGVSDLYNTVTNTFKSENKTGLTPTAKTAAESSYAGCPAVLKSIFGGGSVLEKIGEAKGIPSSHIATFRGYIGDAYVFTPAETGGDPIAVYNPPCGKSDFDGMVKGTSQIQDTSGACSDNPDANGNLVNYVSTRLVSVASAIKNKSAITTQDAQFLQSIPLPIWPALRAAVQTNSESMVIGKLSEISARGLAFMMVMDLATRIKQGNDYARHAKTAKRSAEGAAPETCQLVMFEDPFRQLEQVEKNAIDKSNEAYQRFSAAASDVSAIEALVANLEKFNNIARQEMTRRFSAGAANRALRGGA